MQGLLSEHRNRCRNDSIYLMILCNLKTFISTKYKFKSYGNSNMSFTCFREMFCTEKTLCQIILTMAQSAKHLTFE